MLDHRRATTHWTRVELFARTFPKVHVLSDALFVRDGDVVTAAGVSSAIDLALALVEDDFGHDIASKVAREMVVFLQRPGQQSQFSAPSRRHLAPDDPLRVLFDMIAGDPAAEYSLARMAGIAHVSVRNLTRLFHDKIGTTPARYVESMRIEAAQILLQDGATVALAAARAGFGSPETLRRVFVNRVGSSPSDYVEQLSARMA
jgi:transcriptional regulator GlxA family with amidase domain